MSVMESLGYLFLWVSSGVTIYQSVVEDKLEAGSGL